MLGLQHVVTLDIRLQHIAVAPPRGVRGLKCCSHRSTPRQRVAPPRGVRGLKFDRFFEALAKLLSHPLVGCVD